MPFEDFYKADDEADRRWWKSVVAAFLMVSGYGILTLIVPALLESRETPVLVAEPPRTGIYETYPDFEERRRRIDAVCDSLPEPENFHFVSKTASTDPTRAVSMVYTYRSPRAKEEIFPVFIIWFGANGWTDNKSPYERLEFSKDNKTVWVAPYSTKKDGDLYTVVCTEWKLD